MPPLVLPAPPAPLSKASRRALQVLGANSPVRPLRFAELLWPHSPGHFRRYGSNRSIGSVGAGMGRVAGSVLAALRARGLASRVGPYYRITRAGRAALTGEPVCWPAPRGPTCRRCKLPRQAHLTDGRTTWCPSTAEAGK